MKSLILFESKQDTTNDRIAAWIDHELNAESVALDLNELVVPNVLSQYIERYDQVVIIGRVPVDVTEKVSAKPVLHLFPEDAPSDTTVFFTQPETPHDKEQKAEIIKQLQDLSAV